MTGFPNWFALTAEANFETILPEHFDRDQSLNFLQLGAFTGDASVWLLANFPNSHLTDVDTWLGSREDAHDLIRWGDVAVTHHERMSGFRPRAQRWTGTTDQYFDYVTTLEHEEGGCRIDPYDFIYVDASHVACDVLKDAINSHRHLKSGGIMAFDDYMWAPHEDAAPHLSPRIAIDAFVNCFRPEYRVLANNAQLWVQRVDF